MPRFDRARLFAPAASLLAIAAAMLLPAGASALDLQIVDKSGHEPEDVYVTVVGQPGAFEVPGMVNDEPKKLSEIPGQKLTIDKLISGRVYVSYGAGVQQSVSFDSPTRFDWAELTVTPASSDVANLTAVDQFGIGMRLDTYGTSNEHLDWLGDANSDTIFQALQQIPGGSQATVRNGSDVVRVVSPNKAPSAYPDLGDYVRSMSGKTITLHTAFFGSPFVTSEYSGTFAADGSIALSGTSNPAGQAPATIPIAGDGLIDDIYTGANTPNDLEGAIRRDVLAGFSTGFWGGRYGNDAFSFCSNPQTTAQGSWCPNGFNKPAFGDARLELSPYATCEQYAAVINQYADTYGNPYSDAAKEVQVGLDPAAVKTLKLTILADSGDAQPKAGGNPECGAAPSSSSFGAQPAASSPSGAAPVALAPVALPPVALPPVALREKVGVHLRRRVRVGRRKVKVGRVACASGCGRIKALVRRGRRVVARRIVKRSGARRPLVLCLTRFGRRALVRHRRLEVRLDVWVGPRRAARHLRRPLLLVHGARR